MIKKTLSCLFFILIIFNLHGEVVGVPNLNYSVNPLEGWEIQGYESEKELSWLSMEGDVAFTISTWEGDRFSNVTAMFNEITEDLDAYGDCVRFEYLDFEGAIGEISFNIGGRSHKGWVIFLNGMLFDYYMTAFTLADNYDNRVNEIQSVLDSFSYGEEGELNPGPISEFLNQSPSKTLKKHTVDFFDNDLFISVSDYDFANAQSVIEREATIMLNYSSDPSNFYNAWARYYQMIFRDNYSRLDPLYNALYPYFAGDKYTDYETVELLMFWVQGFTYGRSLERTSDLLNPLEASTTKLGDCDARSLILAILIHKFDIESILLTSEKAKHAFLAVDIPGEGFKYTFEEKEYIGIELTTKALIGEIRESLTDLNLWTPVKMDYDNGF